MFRFKTIQKLYYKAYYSIFDIKAKYKDGWTALHWAICNDKFEEVDLLIKAGADLEDKDNDSYTALHLSILQGNLKIIDLLIKAGANINAKENNGYTAFHMAALDDKLKIIKYFVEEVGVNIEVKNDDNWTALCFAAYQGQLEVIKYLSEEAGADLEDKDGFRAVDLLRIYLLNNNLLNSTPHIETLKNLINVSIEKKLFKQLPLTEEEETFKTATNYNLEYFNNIKSNLLAEKKYHLPLNEEDKKFMLSKDYNSKYELKYQKIIDGFKVIAKHSNRAALNSEDMINEIAGYLTRENPNKFVYLSYSIAKELDKIEARPEKLDFNDGLIHGMVANPLIRCTIDAYNGKVESSFYQCAIDGFERTLAYSLFLKELSITGFGPFSALAGKIIVDTIIENSSFTVEYGLDLAKSMAISFSSIALPTMLLSYEVITNPYVLGIMVQTSPILLEPGAEVLFNKTGHILETSYNYFVGDSVETTSNFV